VTLMKGPNIVKYHLSFRKRDTTSYDRL